MSVKKSRSTRYVMAQGPGLRTFCLRIRVRLRLRLSGIRIVVCGYGRGYGCVAPRLHQVVCGYGPGYDALHPGVSRDTDSCLRIRQGIRYCCSEVAQTSLR